MNNIGHRISAISTVAVLLLIGTGVGAEGAANEGAETSLEAKKVFGSIKAPLKLATRSIGSYSLGCIAGARQLPISGPNWQAMRLSRNRIWGHPVLISFIEKLATDSHRLDGSTGLLIGDMGQPLGGPMITGHASHQIGLDVDLWFKPMPSHLLSTKEREDISADDMVDEKALTINKSFWTGDQVKLLKRAASYPEVVRVFVHPAIKKALCEGAGTDRAWLSKIRPWWGHNDHFHVRLNCPSGSPGCVAQTPPAANDDGCGQELDDWFKQLRAPAPKTPAKPPKILLMSDMPKECQELVKSAKQPPQGKAAAK